VDLLEQLEGKKIYGVFDSDLDGVSSRTIAEYYLNPIASVYYLNTFDREMSEFEMEYADLCDIILFTDITPTLDLYNTLVEKGKEVIIFDHHLTGRDTLGERDNYYFDESRCGCKIFYDELTKGIRKNRVIEKFVYLVNIYDLYNTDSEDWSSAKGLHNTMYGYVDWRKANYQTDTEKYLNFIVNQLKKFRLAKSFYFTSFEEEKMQKALKREQTCYEEARRSLRIRTDNEGNNYGWMTCSSKLSPVSNRLLNDLGDKVKYVVCHATYKEKDQIAEDKLKISLRCGTDFDIRFIAEKHSGGGHPQASGAYLTYQEFKDLKEGRIHLI